MFNVVTFVVNYQMSTFSCTLVGTSITISIRKNKRADLDFTLENWEVCGDDYKPIFSNASVPNVSSLDESHWTDKKRLFFTHLTLRRSKYNYFTKISQLRTVKFCIPENTNFGMPVCTSVENKIVNAILCTIPTSWCFPQQFWVT